MSDGFEAAYLRNMNKYLNAVIPIKFGVLELPDKRDNVTMLGIDGVVQLQYWKKDAVAIPYVMAGAGAVFEDFSELDFQLPFGAGVNFSLGTFGYVNAQIEYRRSIEMDRHNLHYGIGLGFMLGKYTEEDAELPVTGAKRTDTDDDGIPDADDDCPNEKGLKALNGCPDGDDDGVIDSKDKCPDQFGPKATMGCPDSDRDGVANQEDECPDIAGSLRGCPDSDGDGVPDKDDRCPEEAGTAINAGCLVLDSDGDGVEDKMDECPEISGTVKGCPDGDKDGIADKDDACPYAAGEGRFNGCPDTDGDGIDDSKDKCPNMAAPGSPIGCPAIANEDREVLDYALQAVQFEFGSDKLMKSSDAVLDQVLDVMNKYPDYKLEIIGHTDDVGTERRNLDLSINRAKACYDYLSRKGIAKDRMSYGGFGETRPISSNATEEGRKFNRRVEFNLVVK